MKKIIVYLAITLSCIAKTTSPLAPTLDFFKDMASTLFNTLSHRTDKIINQQHKFSSEGKLLKTWGTCGSNPGQFAWPHNVAVDGYGKVYVCDRENDRIQIFTADGEFVDMWTDFMNPHNLYIDQKRDLIYTVEGNLKVLSKPGQESRVTIRDLNGKVLSSWQGRESDGGVFESPHDICVDSRGDIYTAELRECDRIQKFVKVN